MEYQYKKKQVLQQVEYTNLLTVTLAENRLQRNFRTLVEAMMLNQEDIANLREQLNGFMANNSSKLRNLHDKIGDLQAKLEKEEGHSENMSSKKISTPSKSQRQMISQPHLNFNFVESQKDIQDHTDMNEQVQMFQKINDDRYNELKGILNTVRHDQMQNSNLANDLSNIKDQINALKGQLKTVSDRSQRSIKRVSLGGIENQFNSQIPGEASKQDKGGVSTTKIQEQFDKELNNLHIEINTIKISLEELKEMNADSRRKDSKTAIAIDDLQKNLKKLGQKENFDVENLEKQIKELKMEAIMAPTKKEPSKKVIENSVSTNKENSNNGNSKEISNLNEKLAKLQGVLNQFATTAEVSRLKSNIQQKIQGLQAEDEAIKKQLKDEVQMLMEINDEKNEKLKGIQKQVKENKDEIKENASHFERKNNITNSRIEELRKNLQNLKEDLEFYKTMNEDSKGQQQPNVMINQNKDDRKDAKVDNKSIEQLKKYFNRKLHDQRSYLLGLIRDIEKKSGNKNGFQQDLSGLWDKVGELNLFLNKKANQEDIKKHLGYLDKKIGSIYNKMNSREDNNDDARIAKTNWFCLSCDKNLQNYQGKVGKHIVWDSMPMKTGFSKMTTKEDKKSLPTLKR